MLSHGDGGLLTHELLRELFYPGLHNEWLAEEGDSAVVNIGGERIAFSTDSFVVSPLFFPGGDIGKLAVYGTVNDLVMCGARPEYLSAAFILAEGLQKEKLSRVVRSISVAASALRVPVVAGDTKVVESANPDNLFINTTGIGPVPAGVSFDAARLEPSDVVVVTGNIGNHGAAVLASRLGLEESDSPQSDCAALTFLLEVLEPFFPHVKIMRDPTRGGVATTLNEIASKGKARILIEEKAIPMDPKVKAVAEILGIDPLYLACEGRALLVVSREASGPVLEALREHPRGREACAIGTVNRGKEGLYLQTPLGGTRRLHMLAGAPLPRIC